MLNHPGASQKDTDSLLQLTQFAMDNVSVGIYWIDRDACIHYANNHACKMLGYTNEELTRLTLADLDPNFPIERWNEHWLRLKQDKTETYETRHKRKDGSTLPVEVVSNFLSSCGHEYKVAFATDISERKRKEAESLSLRNQLQSTLDAVPDLLFEVGFNGNIYAYHSPRTDLLAAPPQVFLGKSFTDVLPPDVAKICLSAILEANEKGLSTGKQYELQLPQGKLWFELSVSRKPLIVGQEPRFIFLARDITERRAAADEIKFLAFYDPLTGLANRRLMSDRMEQLLSLARRTGELVAICMLDLDGFKKVNDEMGHDGGDQLLIEVAKRLQECIRESDTASRFGGDEFSVILGGFKENGECIKSINRIISKLAEPYIVNNQIARVTASVGTTIFPNDGGSPDQLLRHADEAMYDAKNSGKNCYRLFNPSLMDQYDANQGTLKKIEKALAKEQFVLYYQPQVDCLLGKVTGVEALIRWKHPVLGLLLPSDFLPLIEQHDLIIHMGEWVIQSALKQLAKWKSSGIDGLTIAVNISSRQLHQLDFIDRLSVLLDGYDAEIISRLEIEVIETSVLEDIKLIAGTIQKCRELGIRIAIDDFGTGFSSLAHLKKIPFDVLKIDKSFIFEMLRNPEDWVLVNSIIGLAISFKRKVIAEGVESIDHVLMLLEMKCNHMQGFEIAHPMPADQIASWIRKFAPNPLWKLVNSERPSRDYFEIQLAEVNHRHLIEQLIHEQTPAREILNPELLLDHRNCRLGRWFYADGCRLYGSENWFLAIETLHQQIHRTAEKIIEHKRLGKLAEMKTEEVLLMSQQEELDLLLRKSREKMAEQFKTNYSTNPSGEPL